MKTKIDLVKVYPKMSDSSLDMVIVINGKTYEFAIRECINKDGTRSIKVLKTWI